MADVGGLFSGLGVHSFGDPGVQSVREHGAHGGGQWGVGERGAGRAPQLAGLGVAGWRSRPDRVGVGGFVAGDVVVSGDGTGMP